MKGRPLVLRNVRTVSDAVAAGHRIFVVNGDEYVLASTLAYVTCRKYKTVRSWLARNVIPSMQLNYENAEAVHFILLRDLHAFIDEKLKKAA